MLLAVCACAALASAASALDYQNDVPKFSDAYFVQADATDMLGGTRKILKNWYDEKLNKSRLDINGNAAKLVVVNPVPKFKVSDIYKVYIFTDEIQMNQVGCIYSKDYPYPSFHILPDMTKKAQFIGKERCIGAEAYHWRTKTGNPYYPRIVQIDDVWVTYTNNSEGGDMVTVPLRYISKLVDTKSGKVLIEDKMDYFSYQAYQTIDPNIFNITKDIPCEDVGSSKMSQINLPSFFQHKNEFDLFTMAHNKQYASQDEHRMRMEIFKKNVEMIERHNRGNHSYKLAVNKFADRTAEELRAMLGRKPTAPGSRSSLIQDFPLSDAEVEALMKEAPKKFDWRRSLPGSVTAVKDQGECGSCWAFSAIGAVEGANAITNLGFMPRLSEQALMDCSWGFGNGGCGGGDERMALEYILKHGIPKYSQYGHGGYNATTGYCHAIEEINACKITNISAVPANDEKKLKAAIFKYGPVTVTMHVSEDFLFYSHGVYTNPECLKDDPFPNHALLAIGWGELGGQKYWLVKNSWGTRWGIDGYVLMDLASNVCGIANAPYVAHVDKKK